MEFNDFLNFEKFVAPALIKIIYWIGLVLIALSTLGGVLGMNMLSSYGGGHFSVAGAILALIGGALFMLLWRVMCEIWIVIFSINDRLGVIADKSKNGPAA